MILLSLILSVSTPALSAERPVPGPISSSAPLVGALATAFTFAADYEKELGRPLGTGLVGVVAEAGGDEAATAAYVIREAGKLSKEAYGCGFKRNGDRIEGASCAAKNSRDAFAYEPGTRVLPLIKFEEASVEAAELFQKKVGRIAQITKAMLWQSGGNVEVALTYRAGEATKLVYMVCDQHGAHFDCHTQSRPGKNQPSR